MHARWLCIGDSVGKSERVGNNGAGCWCLGEVGNSTGTVVASAVLGVDGILRALSAFCVITRRATGVMSSYERAISAFTTVPNLSSHDKELVEVKKTMGCDS